MERLHSSDPLQVGGFSLVARLGSGGMGVVYLASRGVERVALKVLNPSLIGDPPQRERFAREADALARCSSRRVASLQDWYVSDHEAWLAMEYVNGPNLRDFVLHAGALQPRSWRAVLKGVLEGLAELHSRGIVHRDIKPSNIVLSSEGPKIIDFGISQTLDATRLTQTGSVEGSPAWLSPEQLELSDFGPESDVFSLASTMVYAATGKSPWGDADTLTIPVVFSRILGWEPDYSGITADQSKLLGPMHAKSPEQRPTVQRLLEWLSDVNDDVFREATWLKVRQKAERETAARPEDETSTTTAGPVDPDMTLVSGGAGTPVVDDPDMTLVSGEPGIPAVDDVDMTEVSGPTQLTPQFQFEEDIEATEQLAKPVRNRTTRAKGSAYAFLTPEKSAVTDDFSNRTGTGLLRSPAKTAPLAAVIAGVLLAAALPVTWAWVSWGSVPEYFENESISLSWAGGGVNPDIPNLEETYPLNERELLDAYYNVNQDGVTRDACLPSTEHRDFGERGLVPFFEVQLPDGSWDALETGIFDRTLACPDGFVGVSAGISSSQLASSSRSGACTMYRYVEPESEMYAERIEQWCIDFDG